MWSKPKAADFECRMDGVLVDQNHHSYPWLLNERWHIAACLEKVNMMRLSDADIDEIAKTLAHFNKSFEKVGIVFKLLDTATAREAKGDEG